MLSNPTPTTVREYSTNVRLELENIQSARTLMDAMFWKLKINLVVSGIFRIFGI